MSERYDATVCWDRTTSHVIGVFHPRALAWLRRHLSSAKRMLEWRTKAYRADDSAAFLLDVKLPSQETDYPPLAALLDRFQPDDEPDELRLWWEPDLVSFLHLSADVALSSLPERGGVVTLDDRQVDAWNIALPMVRIIYAVSFRVWDPPEGTTERGLAAMPEYNPDSEQYRNFVDWLGYVIRGLSSVTRTEPAEQH